MDIDEKAPVAGHEPTSSASERPDYLTRQLITCIGNKRSLAPTLELVVGEVRRRMGGRRLVAADLFAGSGFVARLLKRHADLLIANDLEPYSAAVNRCFLRNADKGELDRVRSVVGDLNQRADRGEDRAGFIRDMYSPADDQDIRPGERVFYSNDNARRLDFFAQEIAAVDPDLRDLALGPLLSRASMHANTSGVFKGFYKDKHTGRGKFGAAAGDALTRILQPIALEVPVLSRFDCDVEVHCADANALAPSLPRLDLAYVDPPYNQHPYGSNYFMLNLLVDYQRPNEVSDVSGIPVDWQRSGYNVRRRSLPLLLDLLDQVPARFLLISFNSEGYISLADLRSELDARGTVDELVVRYNTFRGSRNLRGRALHVNEHLFLVDRG